MSMDYNERLLGIASKGMKPWAILYGNSSVTKPAGKYCGGSLFFETDTGKKFRYDDVTDQWYEEASGGGGGSSGIFVRFVTNGDSFPTERPDGSPLENEDYVKPNPTSTFPFTIDGVEFKTTKTVATYYGGIWTAADADVAMVEVEALPTSTISDVVIYHLLHDEVVSGVVVHRAGYWVHNKTKWERLVLDSDQKYLSVERLDEYLYKVTFDTIPDYVDGNVTAVGGCSAFVRDGKLYRNYDWQYDNTATFVVKCKNFTGNAAIVGLDDGNLDMVRVGQLPYHLLDGVNTDGIMVSTHVLNNDFGYAGSGAKDKRIMGLPYYILSNVHSIGALSSTIANYLANLNIPAELAVLEYLVQFIVTDGTTTYAITPKTDGSGYEVVDATTNPKMTNFKWVNRAEVSRFDMDLQNRPTGVERWNLIGADTKLKDLRFTLAYQSPDRLSEFIGVDGTTKSSTDAELMAIYNEAHAEYLIRTRNGATWQTVYSVVYDRTGIQNLHVQERYGKEYSTAVDFTTEAVEYTFSDGTTQTVATNLRNEVI